jgi:hypothetical protein
MSSLVCGTQVSFETVPMHHVLSIRMCENIEDESRRTASYCEELEMKASKRFLAVVRGDKKLLGMFGGIVVDVVFLVAVLVTALVWYLQ